MRAWRVVILFVVLAGGDAVSAAAPLRTAVTSLTAGPGIAVSAPTGDVIVSATGGGVLGPDLTLTGTLTAAAVATTGQGLTAAEVSGLRPGEITYCQDCVAGQTPCAPGGLGTLAVGTGSGPRCL